MRASFLKSAIAVAAGFSIMGLVTTAAAGSAPQESIPLAWEVEQTGAPGPDGTTYSLDMISCCTAYWHVVAVDSPSANDTISLYDDEARTTLLARGSLKEGKIDFVTALGDDIDPTYAVVTRKSGSNDYTVESSAHSLVDNGAILTYQIRKADLVRAFTLNSSGAREGETVTLAVDPASKKLDVSLFLMAADGSNYRPRELAVAEARSGGPGETETLVYTLPSTGTYGLIVLYEKGKGTYTLTRVDS